MLPYRDSRITRIVLIIFFLLLAIYAYFEAQGLLFGPSIVISSEVTEIHQPLVTIEGRADRISALTMNGKAVQVTEDGAFSEEYLLSPGYNRITFEAKDKYNRSRAKVLELVYTPDATAPTTSADTTLDAASSTPLHIATSTPS